jgi:hypothetical protein
VTRADGLGLGITEVAVAEGELVALALTAFPPVLVNTWTPS